MSRQLVALLVSSAMVFGSISSSVSAQSNAAQVDPAQLNVKTRASDSS